MKATETKLLDFLKGPKQFVIPIYQRTYSWTQPQCEQLWKDIVKTATDDTIAGHFIGSIVYIQKGIYQVASIPQLLVIDGQQRLTTLSLLLYALGESMQQKGEGGEMNQRKLNNYFLFNSEEQDDLRHKLILTQTDKTTLCRLFEGKELVEPMSRRIEENFRYFQDQIAKANIDPDVLYRGVAKLIIVDIALDREHDNPQLIFESLNSTGLELSQADLIRNYVLMGLEPQEQTALYEEFWFQMEQNFGQINYTLFFDQFMRDYLTLKTGRIPRIQEVYQAFKVYANANRNLSIRDIVTDIYKYSKYFVAMALEQEEDKELRSAFTDINALKVDVAYPLLLEMYDDFTAGTLNHNDFLAMLRLIESYVFRRAICGIPTNSLNKTFAGFTKELKKERYVESFKVVMLLKDSYRRFPNDNEFKRALMDKDLYNFRSRVYWLRKIENHGRKERVDVEGYTIEHIMPQNPNLSVEWKTELGENWKEVQATYLHTLGNLTLTGYNSEYSDAPFINKRGMKDKEGHNVGFVGSPLRLNEGLGSLEHWNENEIKKRAGRLATEAIQVWRYPDVDPAILEQYTVEEEGEAVKTYTRADHHYLTGDTLKLFEQLRTHILNLDPSVREEILKLYIAYKMNTNFVDVIVQKNQLQLVLNMRFTELDDPKKLGKDITGKGRWGNGDVQVELSSPDQLGDVMALVKQSFAKQADNGD